MKPLVSIIIPVYNAEEYIVDTIESCLNQRYSQFEILVINDGSSDNSEALIETIEDPRIKYFKLENRGPCYARNYGMERAAGELLQFLDADDILHPEKLSQQIDQYLKYGDEFIYSAIMGCIVKNEKSLEEGFEFYYRNLSVTEYFKKMFGNFGKYFTTGIWLVPKNIIQKTGIWDEKVKINNDGEFFSRAILLSKGVIFSPGAIFYYRRDVPMSVSKNFVSKEIYKSWLYSYTCYAYHFQQNLDNEIAKELGRKALSVYYCNSYPKYPDLLKECKRGIQELGFKSPVPHGGKTFKQIAGVLGVDFALKIRALKDRIKLRYQTLSQI